MGERLDIKKMKEIAHDIIDEESKKNNINVNVFPLTFVEYREGFEKREGRKFKLYNAILYVGARGYYEVGSGNLYVCLENLGYLLKLDNEFKLAEACYHEFRHRVQDNFDAYSYDGFLRDIDNCIEKMKLSDYMLNHDSYSFEIGANMYAVSKAKEYIQKKYPQLYEELKDYIDRLEQKYTIDYLSYDASDTVERFIQRVKDRKKRDKNVGQKSDNGKIKKVEVPPVLEIFLDDNQDFKKVSEIINNDKFKQLDQRIVSAMFSCRTFLDGLDMESLSLEELEVVSNALEYTNNVYKNQVNSLDKFKPLNRDSFLKILKSEKSFIKKMIELNKYSGKLLFKIFKKTEKKLGISTAIGKVIRDNDEQLENMQLVSRKLNQSKKLVKQKNNRGFFVSDMFYIIGLLFSLLTILYLIISKL